MSSSVSLRQEAGHLAHLVTGENVALRLAVGSALELGASVRLSVVNGALILTGEDLIGDPNIEGAIYVDPATRVLKVSAG